MGNQCQFVHYPNHDRVYRACIYTCDKNDCNGASTLTIAFSSFILTLTVLLCHMLRWTDSISSSDGNTKLVFCQYSGQETRQRVPWNMSREFSQKWFGLNWNWWLIVAWKFYLLKQKVKTSVLKVCQGRFLAHGCACPHFTCMSYNMHHICVLTII